MEKIIGRKGQTPQDAILAVVFLVILAIAGMFAYYIFGQVFNGLETSSINTTPNYNTTIQPVFEKGRAVNGAWDYIVLALLFGFALAVIITGYFIDVHTMFLPIYIVGLLIGVAFSFIFSYIYTQMVITAPLSTIVAEFPIADNICSNLPLYFTIIGVLGMIATYAKANMEGA